jgi:hypothetical protein
VGSPRFLAAGREGERFVLHGLSAAGETTFAIDLPGRGHAACAHPGRPLAVAFARRPGSFALVLDCRTGAAVARLTPPAGRQFNGHGTFAAGGEVLLTSEVVAETSEGRIGLWQFPGFRRIGEWATGGLGPHDVMLLPDGRVAVANGGIATDPQDRRKLNLATMRPTLALLSAEGRMEDQVALDPALAQASIRHLAVAADGSLAFAMQWEGDPAEVVPLMGLWRPGTPPHPCPLPEAEAPRMQGYAGSIAVGPGGEIALTSPRGGVVVLCDATGAHLATHARADLCGVAAGPAGLVATDGAGAVWSCTAAGLRLLRRGGPAWDNHLIALA